MNRFNMMINHLDNLYFDLEGAKNYYQDQLELYPNNKSAKYWTHELKDTITHMENCREAIEILKKNGGE